jgi:hypothetical protein
MGALLDKDGGIPLDEPQAEGGGATGQDSVDIADHDAVVGAGTRKEGWLVKQGHLVKNWKRRYFVLDWPVLKYYKDPGDPGPRGHLLCDQVTLSEKLAFEKTKKEHAFGIFHPDRKSYFLQAADEAEMMSWVKCIRNEKKVGLIDFDEVSMVGKVCTTNPQAGRLRCLGTRAPGRKRDAAWP